MHRQLSLHLSGAQLGLTIVSLLLGFVAEPTIARVIEPLIEPVLGERTAKGVAIGLALTIATVLSMVVGELIPKNLVLAAPEKAALLLATPLRLFTKLLGPFIAVANGIANRIVRRFGIEPKEELGTVRSLDELESLIRSSGQEGTLDPEKLHLLTRSIRFGEKTAASALVPRPQVEFIEGDATVAELVDQAVRTGFSRFPVVAGDLDDVLGVVHVKDVYRLPAEQRAASAVRAITSEALAVPETRELEELFGDLRRASAHMAIVVDEHGGTAGIVTLEDLLEEIVGEIDDEYDPPVTGFRAERDTGACVVAGTLHPDEVQEACGFEVPEGKYDTIAGFVLDRLGHLPEPGERVVHDGWTVEVREMDRRRIASLRLVPDRVGDAAGGRRS